LEFQFYVVDVFPDKTFEWNQSTIFTLAEGLSDKTIQKIAKEFNLT